MPTKPKPKSAKVCLVCAKDFLGTPAATRCDDCRSEGLKVPTELKSVRASRSPSVRPAERSAKCPSSKHTQVHERTCGACLEIFTTHKPKARRCPTCIDEDRKVQRRICIECNTSFALTHSDQVNCQSCAYRLEIGITDMTPEQRERFRAQRRLEDFKRRRDGQLAWLDNRANPPRGYPRMKKADSKSTLSKLWIAICASDGAASASIVRSLGADIQQEDRVSLLVAFFRLRVDGYHPTALAKLCPEALLGGALKYQTNNIDLPAVSLGLTGKEQTK